MFHSERPLLCDRKEEEVLIALQMGDLVPIASGWNAMHS